MSGKSVTELVGNLRRPFEGEDHVWLATRGPGEFVGRLASSACKSCIDYIQVRRKLCNCMPGVLACGGAT